MFDVSKKKKNEKNMKKKYEKTHNFLLFKSIGCIQALQCHTDRCPSGVATQAPERQAGLHVPTKAMRAANYHRATLGHVCKLVYFRVGYV